MKSPSTVALLLLSVASPAVADEPPDLSTTFNYIYERVRDHGQFTAKVSESDSTYVVNVAQTFTHGGDRCTPTVYRQEVHKEKYKPYTANITVRMPLKEVSSASLVQWPCMLAIRQGSKSLSTCNAIQLTAGRPVFHQEAEVDGTREKINVAQSIVVTFTDAAVAKKVAKAFTNAIRLCRVPDPFED